MDKFTEWKQKVQAKLESNGELPARFARLRALNQLEIAAQEFLMFWRVAALFVFVLPIVFLSP